MQRSSTVMRRLSDASALVGRRGVSTLGSSAENVRERLMRATWTEEQPRLVAAADGVIRKYRADYTGEQDDTYKAVERLYRAKAASEMTDLLSEAYKDLGRSVLDSTGALGTKTRAVKETADEMNVAFDEFGAFMNSLEDEDIKDKVAKELGQKVVAMRQTSQIDQFSAHFKPIACDHMVTDSPKQTFSKRPE